jgi:hypothetical protein
MKNYTAKKSSKTKYQMKKKHSFALWICLFSSAISYAQLSHEFHLGFSGLRIFEINPPEFLPQNLDYYLSPAIGYDLQVADNRVAIGLRLGPIYENGNNTFETVDFVQIRKEKRHSQLIEIRLAYNFIMQKKSYFQIGGGLRYGQVFYYSLNRVTNRSNNSVGIFNFESKNLKDPFLDYVFFLAYQLDLNQRRISRKHSLGMRFALDILYIPPREGVLINNDNKYSSIALGPSVSLVWRINGKRNGLY